MENNNKEMSAEKLLTRAEELVQNTHNFECQLMVSVTLTGKDQSIIENQLSNHSTVFQDKAMIDIAVFTAWIWNRNLTGLRRASTITNTRTALRDGAETNTGREIS